MTTLSALLLAILGGSSCAFGGFLLGRWWSQRARKSLELRAEKQISEALGRVLGRIEVVDSIARETDQLAHGGRTALSLLLQRIRDLGGYAAVAISDDHGLVIAGDGNDSLIETMAVEAASFATRSEHIGIRRQAILQVRPDDRWAIHRYFEVDGARLCISASRQGGTVVVRALDGALAALERVLSSRVEPAA